MLLQTSAVVLLYLVATMILGVSLYNAHRQLRSTYLWIIVSAVFALVLHLHILVQNIMTQNSINLSLFNALSLVSFFVTAIASIVTFYRPVASLLLFLFPLAALTVILQYLLPHHTKSLMTPLPVGMQVHIFLSICSYSLLFIASLQGLLFAFKERLLKKQFVPKLLDTLPPIQVMEDILIQIIVVGFILLSLSLVSGMIFIEDIFAQHLAHKIILACLAWFIYAMMLYGRWVAGWRGKYIVKWLLCGFFVLLLAYIGTKFVLELIIKT